MPKETNWREEFREKFCYRSFKNRDGSFSEPADSGIVSDDIPPEEYIDFISNLLQQERGRIVEEVDNFGDIWKLEKTAEETGGCPIFTRVNRDIIKIIKEESE